MVDAVRSLSRFSPLRRELLCVDFFFFSREEIGEKNNEHKKSQIIREGKRTPSRRLCRHKRARFRESDGGREKKKHA